MQDRVVVDPISKCASLRKPVRKIGYYFSWRHDADCQCYHSYDKSRARRARLRSSRGRCIACSIGASPGEFVSLACDRKFLSTYFAFQRRLLISELLLSVEIIVFIPAVVL